MKASDLNPNPKNPRRITDDKLAMLKKALTEFGDLSGLVYNRRTQQLVGGHQRLKIIPLDAEITIDHLHKTPTRTGTVAEGHVEIDGEAFKYREVDWDEAREKAANIAANKHGGEWDNSMLQEWIIELDQFSFDPDLLGFNHEELIKFLVPEFQPGTADEQGSLDKKKDVECPNCGELFQPK